MTAKVPHQQHQQQRRRLKEKSDWGETALYGGDGGGTDLLGGPKVLDRGLDEQTKLEAHDMLLDGLRAGSVRSLINLLRGFGYTESDLEKAVGASLRTVQRQNKTPRKLLSPEQSGRMWKFAEILSKATKVFGSQREAAEWIKRPATGLEQRSPIDLLQTPAGTELVENFLGRLEYDVYT